MLFLPGPQTAPIFANFTPIDLVLSVVDLTVFPMKLPRQFLASDGFAILLLEKTPI